MSKSSRVVCHTCGAQLGIVLNDRLSVEGHRVDIGPGGEVTITCVACKTPHPWTTEES